MNCLKSESSFQVTWKIPVKWASSHPEMNALYTAKLGIEPHFMILALGLKPTHKQIMKVVYWRLQMPFLKPQANSPQQSDTRTFLDHFPSKHIQRLWPSLLWPTLGWEITPLCHTIQVKKLKWWNQLCKIQPISVQYCTFTKQLNSHNLNQTFYRKQGRYEHHSHGEKSNPRFWQAKWPA